MSERIKTTALALVLLGLLAAYVAATTQLFSAHRAVASSTLKGLEEGVRRDPWNAEYGLLLARSRTLGMLDFSGGIAQYQRALALNPYSSRGWLDLAAAYQMAGDPVGQRTAMQRAVSVDPNTPSVAWEVATFYILQDDVKRALPHYRTVLSSQGNETRAVLDVLWPATEGNVDLMLKEVVPAEIRAYVDFLRFAVEKKDISAADKVWAALMGLKSNIPVRETLPYFQLLLDARQAARAQSAWSQLATSQPALAGYQANTDDLIINGDFEEEILGGGLEWTFQKGHYVELSVDSLEFRSGNQSLAATFNRGPAPSLGLTQLVPVSSSRDYQFSVFAKADGLVTASGPRISISDAYTGQRYFLSEDCRGTTAWKQIQSSFRTGPESTLLKIEVVREPSQSLIQGKLYLDDFTLRPN